MKRFTILFFLFAFSLTPLGAQEFMFKHLEVKDGLPNNSIGAILKDSKGFMWFGTASGLARYDGYDFKNFRTQKNDTLSLLDNYVDYLVEDRENNLWMRSGGEIILYNLEKEYFVRTPSDYFTKAGLPGKPHYVYIDEQGDYWFYQNWNGCYYYQRESGETKKLLVAADALPNTQLTSMAEHDGMMVLAFNNGELYGVDVESMSIRWKDTTQAEQFPANTMEQVRLFKDSENLLWVYSVRTLGVYDLENNRWLPRWERIFNNRSTLAKAIAEDAEGRIWIGTDKNGIEVWDKKTATYTNVLHNLERENERGLQHNTMSVIYADDNNMMWVGTDKKGISYYDKSIYKFEFELMGDINAIEEADNGCLWLGTNDAGLIHWNPKTNVKRVYTHGGAGSLTSDVIVSMLRASDGKLWIGTYLAGLNCFDGKTFKHYKHQEDNPNSLSSDNVWSLAEDDKGNIWIATLGGGLQCLDPKTDQFTTYNLNNSGLHSNFLASVCYSKKNCIVVGTASEGVTILNLSNQTFHNITEDTQGRDLHSNQSVIQVYEDSRGLIWIATRDGLYLYDMEKKSMKPVYSSMTSERFISGITEDESGNMWVTTAKGVTNIILTQPEKTSEYSLQFMLYDEKDGLQSSEFNQRAIKRLPGGEIMMGGLYGVNLFHPEDIRYNSVQPHVMFSSFRLFNQQVEVGKEYDGQVVLKNNLNSGEPLTLDYKQNVFTIGLATDCYILPNKTRYVFKMEGFNDSWMTLPEGESQVTYTNLSPGKYNLVVKAVNSDDVAGAEASRLTIVIKPPFWRTPWAYAIYAVLVLLAVYGASMAIKLRERNRYKIRQMEEDAKKKEEITQMKFRFFTNVSHELRTPLTLIISPLETMMRTATGKQQEQLGMMHRNAVDLLNLVNQLLDFRKMEMAGMNLNPTEMDIVSTVKTVVGGFSMISEKKQVQLLFDSAFDRLEMSFDEDKMSKVVTNLLSNAFKFTPKGGRITVSLELSKNAPDTLQIKVADTGVGISDKDKAHIFDSFYQAKHKGLDNQSTGSGIGLSLVHDFVEMHKGTVKVVDNEGGGTVFVIEIPIMHVGKTTEEKVVQASLLDGEEVTTEIESNEIVTEEYEDEELSSDEAADQLNRAEKNKPLAFVVDDNEDIVSFLESSLSLYFRVMTASNGYEAWQKIPEALPDIVVSDIMMPEVDGNELCRWIKSDSRTQQIPVILLTAKHGVEDTVESLSIGADDYMTKPFNVEVLLLRMRKLLDLYANKSETRLIDPAPSEVKITSMDEQLVTNAIKYVEENISRTTLSVEELSQSLGMSRVHLYKKLLQITGKTPIEFIRIIRLKRAAQLLRESGRNVSEIAYQLGFNNPKYFAKYFKEEFGVLPSVYQSQGQK